MAWEEWLKELLKYTKEITRLRIANNENFLNGVFSDILNEDELRTTRGAFNLVYKWFGLRENGCLNLCNPLHIGSLAIARKVVKHTDNYMFFERPENLCELSEKLIDDARKFLMMNYTEDIDYRNPIHFWAVSIVADEVISFKNI